MYSTANSTSPRIFLSFADGQKKIRVRVDAAKTERKKKRRWKQIGQKEGTALYCTGHEEENHELDNSDKGGETWGGKLIKTNENHNKEEGKLNFNRTQGAGRLAEVFHENNSYFTIQPEKNNNMRAILSKQRAH